MSKSTAKKITLCAAVCLGAFLAAQGETLVPADPTVKLKQAYQSPNVVQGREFAAAWLDRLQKIAESAREGDRVGPFSADQYVRYASAALDTEKTLVQPDQLKDSVLFWGPRSDVARTLHDKYIKSKATREQAIDYCSFQLAYADFLARAGNEKEAVALREEIAREYPAFIADDGTVIAATRPVGMGSNVRACSGTDLQLVLLTGQVLEAISSKDSAAFSKLCTEELKKQDIEGTFAKWAKEELSKASATQWRWDVDDSSLLHCASNSQKGDTVVELVMARVELLDGKIDPKKEHRGYINVAVQWVDGKPRIATVRFWSVSAYDREKKPSTLPETMPHTRPSSMPTTWAAPWPATVPTAN